MEEKIATLNLSQKEIDSARQIYRKVQTGRPKGFIVWLLMALVCDCLCDCGLYCRHAYISKKR